MLASNSFPEPRLPQSFDPVRELLTRVVGREHLSYVEAAQLFSFVLDAAATDAQVAAVLSALATKTETSEELAGMASVMRACATRVNTRHQTFIDTAGTGGSASKTFNVSTAAAFVIAGAGLPVAKHGNGAISSRTGSADVLRVLGVKIVAPLATAQRCLDELDICFLFAPLYHPACARAASIRRQLGIPTAFNSLGPLANPAAAPCQIIGVPDRNRAQRIAGALARLGTTHSWVVSGQHGEDEVSITGETLVFDIRDGVVSETRIDPAAFGMSISAAPPIASDAVTSAAIICEVLSGMAGSARDIVIVNAAAALHVAGVAADLQEATERAQESIDSGAARFKLDALILATNAGVA